VWFVVSSDEHGSVAEKVKKTVKAELQTAPGIRSVIETFDPDDTRRQRVSQQSQKESEEEEDFFCNEKKGDKVIFLDNGKKYCRDKDSIFFPEGDMEKLREVIAKAAFELYEGDKYVSFEGCQTGEVIFIRDNPPENPVERGTDAYWATLLDKDGAIMGTINFSVIGRLGGEEYIEMFGHDLYGSSIIARGGWESEETSLEDVRTERLYRYPTFPPVTEAMATSFLNDYLGEKNMLDSVVSIERRGYSNAYDNTGTAFPFGAFFHEFFVTDANGERRRLMVALNDGLVIDDEYLEWRTAENEKIREESRLMIMRPDREDDPIDNPPQKPRFK